MSFGAFDLSRRLRNLLMSLILLDEVGAIERPIRAASACVYQQMPSVVFALISGHNELDDERQT